MSAEKEYCYWTVVQEDAPDNVFLYIQDVGGIMQLTEDAVNAAEISVSVPYERERVLELLRHINQGNTNKLIPGPRISVRTGEPIVEEVVSDGTVSVETEPPLLTVDITGRTDAAFILARLIAQNHFLLFGSDPVSFQTSKMEMGEGEYGRRVVVVRKSQE